MRKRRGVYGFLVGKSERKRPLGRPRHNWEDSIKMDFQEVGCGDMDWIELADDRDGWQGSVNAAMNLRVLAGNRLASQEVFCSMELVRKPVIKPAGSRLSYSVFFCVEFAEFI
jgi:hypothetical protein